MNTNQQRDMFNDMVQQFNDNFGSAMRTSMRFYEDSMRFFTDAARRNNEQFRARFDKASEEFNPVVRKNMDRATRLVDEQAQRGMDLIRQTGEVFAGRQPSDMYDRMFALWRDSFDTMRQCGDSMTKLSNEMFENFAEMTRCGVNEPSKTIKPTPTK